jgi:hypothetical protein
MEKLKDINDFFSRHKALVDQVDPKKPMIGKRKQDGTIQQCSHTTALS